MSTQQPSSSPNATPTAATGIPEPSRLLEIAVAAAAEAAEYIRGLDRDHIGREYKTSSHDIVTVHDRRCEEIIVAALRRELPECRIVGEEGGERPAQDADGDSLDAHSAVSFYVDPIDGTSNFAAGLPLFCISIGVAVGDDLVAGVIDAPILGTVFTAADGPAMINGVPIQPRPTRPPTDALVLSGFPGHRISREDSAFAGRAAVDMFTEYSAVRHLGTAALELAYVAAGWADGTCLGKINAWDVAAGFHIVRQAGGSVRTWPGDGPVDALDHERPAYVACSGQERLELMDALMDELQRSRDAQRTGEHSAG